MDDDLKKYLESLTDKKLMISDNKLLAADNYRANAKKHIETRLKNGWAEKNAKAQLTPEARRNRSEGIKRSQTPESKARRAQSMRKCIITPDGKFESVKSAGEFYAVKWELTIQGARRRLYKFLKTDKENYYYEK